MPQHDFDIADQLFPATRSDWNAALVALATNSSGNTAPSNPYACQFWADTANGLLKQRNTANTAWITIGALNTTNFGFLSKNLGLTAGDVGSIYKTGDGTYAIADGAVIEAAAPTIVTSYTLVAGSHTPFNPASLPTNTQGVQVLSATLPATTVASATRARVSFCVYVGTTNSSDGLGACLYLGTTPIAFVAQGVGRLVPLPGSLPQYFIGTGSATFTVRVASLNTAIAFGINGDQSSQLLGGALKSFLRVERF